MTPFSNSHPVINIYQLQIIDEQLAITEKPKYLYLQPVATNTLIPLNSLTTIFISKCLSTVVFDTFMHVFNVQTNANNKLQTNQNSNLKLKLKPKDKNWAKTQTKNTKIIKRHI